MNPPPPFTYITNNDTVTITGYTGSGGEVTIPSRINDLPVTSIEYEAFTSSSLSSVVIPDSITNIGSWAFSYCPNLTNVTIGNGITTIEYGLFYDCPNLTSVKIGSKITSILQDAFWITGLTSINIPNSVKSIDAGAFASDSLTNIVIGSGVTSMGDGYYTCPFYGCYNLAAITVDPKNRAFSSVAGVLFDKKQDTLIECPRGLTGSYTVPGNVFNIGNYAFYYCTSLTGIYFKGNAPNLGDFAFSGDNNATAYYLSGTAGWSTTFGGLPTATWTDDQWRQNSVIIFGGSQ